jgi:hypothetical protein
MPRLAAGHDPAKDTDPPTLLAILIGARRMGDRALERVVRRSLEKNHGIKVQFSGTSQRKEAPPCPA